MTTEFKGTPGPWHSTRINNYSVWADDCKVVDVMMVSQGSNYRIPEKDERAANGLLIAAAPDLLEALMAICGANWRDRAGKLAAGRAAIEKALQS